MVLVEKVLDAVGGKCTRPTSVFDDDENKLLVVVVVGRHIDVDDGGAV
jgi:hypothetical protein